MALARGKALHFRFGIVAAHFGHGEHRIVAVGQRADAFDKARDVGVRHVARLELEIERPRARLASVRRRRIVAQLRVVHREVKRVYAEPVDTAIEPETHDAQHCVLHRRIVQVHLRLAGEEIVQVILATPGIPCPGGPTEYRLPV